MESRAAWGHMGGCMQCMGSMQWLDGHHRGSGTSKRALTAPPALHTSPTAADPNPGWGQHNPSNPPPCGPWGRHVQTQR